MIQNVNFFMTWVAAGALVFWLIPGHWAYWRRIWLIGISGLLIFQIAPWACLITIANTFVAFGWSHLWEKKRNVYLFWTSIGTVLVPLVAMRTVYLESPMIVTLGVTFMTLKTIAMVIDSYRAQQHYKINDLLLCNLFFPLYTVGPIERPEKFFLDKIQHNPDPDSCVQGVVRTCIGLFKTAFIAEILIAETLVVSWPEISSNPSAYSQESIYLFVILRFLYTYVNFSGFCDIAIGVGALFGINVAENFNFPIFARNLQDFWRRWHMSLGQWISRYLYFPVVATLRTQWAPYVAIIVAFFLIGWWHETTYTYISWGLLHGFGMAAVLAVKRFGKGNRMYEAIAANPAYIAMTWALTISYVAFAQTFANMKSWDSAVGMTMRLLGLS